VAGAGPDAYVLPMKARLAKVLTVALAAAVMLAPLDPAFARKKSRSKSPPATSGLGIQYDSDGTPIIMQGFRPSRAGRGDDLGPSARRSDRPVRIPRGSSTYIPPPEPSPNAGPPASSLLQKPPPAYRPPPINTYSDRVTNCIHSFPLQGGIGNNPSNPQAYVRQCAN